MITVFTPSSCKVQIKRMNKSKRNNIQFIMVKFIGEAIQGVEEELTETIVMKTFLIPIAVFRETIVAERMEW